LDENDWIEEEKKSFGRDGTIYDFKNIKEIQHSLNSKKKRIDSQEKQVDKRAQGLLSKKEEEVIGK
jgi:hypothetical protein